MTRSASTAVSVERFFEFSVLGLLSSGYLAVAGSGYLDLPTAILTAAGIVLRGLVTAGLLRFEPSIRWVNVATLAYIGFYPLDYLFVSRQFLTATVHLVFFLAVVKVLTAKTTRDYLYLTIIGFLQLLTSAVLSTNLNFFAFLALFMLFGVAAFTSSEIRRSMRKPGTIARTRVRHIHMRLGALSCGIALGILVLTAGMFFLLPRTAQAAFSHLVPERYHLPGFSNEVTLGQIGTILQQKNAVMHVRFFEPGVARYLQWRGAALSEFDGTRWFNPPAPGEFLRPEHGQIILGGNARRWQVGHHPVGYEVQLNAGLSDALFFAGAPEVLYIDSPLIIRTATDSYRVGYGLSDGLRYAAYSFLGEEARPQLSAETLSPALRQRYLQLPALNPRIGVLARSISAGHASDGGRAMALQDYLRRSYAYTIELPAFKPADPMSDFLFRRKKGHCEYFASAMAVMLRSVGIPSRLVNGFQSGVWNPISGWYMIRASDAHSWVEAWLPDGGWTTFDPTPSDLNPPAVTLFSKLNLYLDAADTFWQQWVVAYDLERQLTLAARMQSSSRTASARWLDELRLTAVQWNNRAIGWCKRYGMAVLGLAVGLFCALLSGGRAMASIQARKRLLRAQRGEASSNDATLLYLRMLAVLKRLGFDKPPWLTPHEFARVLPPSETAIQVERLTNAYNQLRFGGDVGAAPRIVDLLRELEGGSFIVS